MVLQGDQQEYIGFVNREADEDSKHSTKYRGRDGKPDVRHTAFFRALVRGPAAAGCLRGWQLPGAGVSCASRAGRGKPHALVT